MRSLEIEGVGLVLTCIVDYKGLRIIGQSVIPGIFAQVRVLSIYHRNSIFNIGCRRLIRWVFYCYVQGENVARLMYGILDKEKMLTVSLQSPVSALFCGVAGSVAGAWYVRNPKPVNYSRL